MYLNGCKLCHICNKNNFLCVNAFTYVMMLIVNKIEKNHDNIVLV
jgi:hypothetical protein